MSTISGLVNSTSTIVTLDIVQRWRGRTWSEERLVRVGRWSGAIALLIGAVLAPVVMRWESIFRYAQDIWAPMAAPVVVVFLCGALWRSAARAGSAGLPVAGRAHRAADAGPGDPGRRGHSLPAAQSGEPHGAGRGGQSDLLGHDGTRFATGGLPRSAGVWPWRRAFRFSALPCGVRRSRPCSSPPPCSCWSVGRWCAGRCPAPACGISRCFAQAHTVRWYASVGVWWLVLAAVFAGIYAWFW